MVYNMRRASCYLALTLLACSLLHRGAHSLRPFTETSSAATISNRQGNSHVQVILGSDGRLTVAPGAAGPGGVASARFTPASARASDFAELRVVTSGGFADAMQMRAAGMAEGYISAGMIADHWHNMQWWLDSTTNQTKALLEWLWEQDVWTRKYVEDSSGKGDAFADGLELLMAQFDGLVDGYAARVHSESNAPGGLHLEPIDRLGFLLLNSFGDIDDLMEMVQAGLLPGGSDTATPVAASGSGSGSSASNQKARLSPRWDALNAVQARRHIAMRGHCSALVKVTADLSDILISHNTWWSFSAMLRVYKHYSFGALAHPALRSKATSFSSYPGTLSSIDDWYLNGDSQLVVTETSNNVYDTSLYRLSTSQAALSWHRARVANMLSSDGSTWAKYIATHNSGTYNNQYLVIDLKRFTPYSELQPGLLTVVETMPGQVVSADRTSDLERGYWPSYNVPAFSEVYNGMGYDALRSHFASKAQQGLSGFDKLDADMSYQLAPRAQLFRRDAGSITDLASLKRVMRSNGWPSDALSTNPWNAISARGDLSPDPDGRSAYGAYDAKVTNYRLALQLTAEAVNGPTWGEGMPPFSWSDWPHVAHRGMRQVFNTQWELQAP